MKRIILALALLLTTSALADDPASKGTEVDFTAATSMAHGDITNSYQVLYDNTSNYRFRACVLNNQTDAPLSFDNGTRPIIESLPAETIYVAPFAQNGRLLSSDIRVKYVTAPTTGTVYLNCFF